MKNLRIPLQHMENLSPEDQKKAKAQRERLIDMALESPEGKEVLMQAMLAKLEASRKATHRDQERIASFLRSKKVKSVDCDAFLEKLAAE